MFADYIRPSWWHDFWVWTFLLLRGEPPCAALELFFSPECKHTQTNSGEKEEISPCIWNLSGGPIKQTAVTALSAWRKQLILILLCHGGSCLDRSQQHRETNDEEKNLKRCSRTLWLPLILGHFLLLGHRRSNTSISLAARKDCSLCHNKENKTETGWERGHLILCQAICSDLSNQFRWPQVLWCTKTVWMTFLSMSFIFPAQSLLMDRACCCTTKRRGAMTHEILWHICNLTQTTASINAVLNAIWFKRIL